MANRKSGMARYEKVESEYLEKRQLRKSAGWILLWALGVGAVISGDFFGWNFGLAVGGFWGLATASLIMSIMYICMVFTIAELSAALPHAGGFFSFTRNAFGPMGGFICGLTDTIEYVITPAVVVVGIGGYMNALVFGSTTAAPPWASVVWWFLAYALFVAINIRGVELTLKVGLVLTTMAVAILVVFYIGALTTGAFQVEKLFNLTAHRGHSATGLPFGVQGVFAALPFAIWFFLAIEQLPLAAEESHNVVQDMPKALILGVFTLLLFALLTLVLNSGVGSGVAAMGNSDAPLADGFRAVFPTGMTSRLLTLLGLTGLVASFHTIIYAYGRVLFALSRAGYIPRWISITGRNHTPHRALILGAVLGFLCALTIEFTRDPDGKESLVGAALLNMAVFGAVTSYVLVMASFIQLRLRRPDMKRPYRSPLDIPGAAVGAAMSLIAMAATFMVPNYRPAVWGVVVFLVVGIIYFLCYSRHRLVASAPEEENSLIAEAEQELAHK